VIRVRLREYAERTRPIFDVLKKRGYVMGQVDAKAAPYKVLGKIIRTIFLRSRGTGKIYAKTASAAGAMNYYRIIFS
jgi:hypothetical protein